MALAVAVATVAACESGNDSGNPPTAKDAGGATDGAASASDAAKDGASKDTVVVQVLAFNDFHGNLRPPSPSNAVVIVPPNDPAISDAGSPVPTEAGTVDGGPLNVQLFAGGAAYFAAHINALRATNPNTLVVASGDVTGASPLVSSLFDDEPTVLVMNAIGVDLTSVGNHEFDHGPEEVLRKQYGGCLGDKTLDGGSCYAQQFTGATYKYLAANVDVVDAAAADVGSDPLGIAGDASTLFPPYAVKTVAGAKIAFIGMTLEGTPTIVSPAGTAGLAFQDETTTVNQMVPLLKAQGVDSIIVLIHQGGFNASTYDACSFSPGTVAAGQHDIGYIADNLDPAVDVVASAHTHVAYNCTRPNGRILTQAASYGRVITQLELTIDLGAHRVVAKQARNVVVTRDIAPDPTVLAIVSQYATLSAPIADRPVGYISADITKDVAANGESTLGDLIADANLAATGADIGFVNIGGVRDSLLYQQYYDEGNGVVTYEKAEAVEPFGDVLETFQCKGQDIINAIQQNVFVQSGGGTKLLQQSRGLTYTWSAGQADSMGQNAAIVSSIKLNGKAINPTATYKVGTVDFVGNGGDGYSAFKNCTVLSMYGTDLAGLLAYLGSASSPGSPIDAPTPNRVTATP